MKRLFSAGVFVALAAAAVVVAAAGTETTAQGQGMAAPAVKEAIAVIHPASGIGTNGIVRFVQDGSAVKVIADLEGLAPEGRHGFHIHEFGDCSAADATSAGSHYDAGATKHHGRPDEAMKHAGDLGNIEADSSGKAHYEATVEGFSILGEQAPIVGRGVIVHAKPDDFSQPVGNAGGRIGCGVIGIMKPAPK